jgi:DNA-binding transcriptional LysR family regulator
VFPRVEVRHLQAVIVLAEELHFTRAAERLGITQSALSKQITEIEVHNKFRLFTRKNKRTVELTNVGRAFVEEARLALLHIDRAVQFGHAADRGDNSVLCIGHSPDVEEEWMSNILAIRLPLYPHLRLQLSSEFSNELVRSVIAGELNLALVTAPPENSQIISVAFAQRPLYAVLPKSHAVAHKEDLFLQDLVKDEWILLTRRVHPVLYDTIMKAAQSEGLAPKRGPNIVTAQQAVHLVSEHVGVALLTKPPAIEDNAARVLVRPLSDASLRFATCVVIRKDDDSRLANEFARSFLRRYAPECRSPRQMELSLSA